MPAAYWSFAGGSFSVWCLLQPLWDRLARLRTTAQGQKRRVAAIDIHPNWDPVNFSFDVAVVHLASAVNGIRPVMLVTPGVDALERPGTLATVTGWGNTVQQPAGPGGGGVNFPDRMQQAQVPIVSRPECRTASATADLIVDATMLCAGRTNLDTCQGDSGGPMFFKAAGGPGHIQVGITSWGIGCGATGFPGVYTRLSNRGGGQLRLGGHRRRAGDLRTRRLSGSPPHATGRRWRSLWRPCGSTPSASTSRNGANRPRSGRCRPS